MIRITADTNRNFIRIYASYDLGWITAFKQAIPGALRVPVYTGIPTATSPNGRFDYWMVDRSLLAEIVSISKEFFPANQVLVASEEEKATGNGDWVRAVFDACPARHYDRLYRALAATFHPDVGGGHELMVRINGEYEYRHRTADKGV